MIPCPFCGGEAVYVDRLSACRCSACEALGPFGWNEADAREAWNGRFFGGSCQVIPSDQRAIPSRGNEAPIDNDPASQNEQRQKPR